jgi:CSLREA domain-containing protein
MKKPKLRFASASLFALLLSSAALFHVATISTAQHATPVVNGSIGLGEYGTLNSQSNGGTTWYVTWDETNLYVGTSGANTTEGAVLYIDADSPLPAGAGTNAGGNATGQTYDSTNFSSLPFRADFVTYYKDSYREFRTADGAGGWSAAATGFGAYASDGSAVRELSIPWSAVTGAGRPDSFSFFAYATSPGGFVYGEVPPENPDGFIGTSATATRFYYVASTADGASTKPFTLNFTQSATHVVNTTADTNDADTADGLCLDSSALCSLRAAIQQANANPSVDAINFLIVGVGTQTINVGSTSLGALPAVVYPLTIDGYTQPGSSQNTLAVGDNAVINVELNGTSAGAGADGLNISAGGSTVRGLSIYRFNGDGIDLNTAGGNTVAGNFIGTNATGAGTTNGNAGDRRRLDARRAQRHRGERGRGHRHHRHGRDRQHRRRQLHRHRPQWRGRRGQRRQRRLPLRAVEHPRRPDRRAGSGRGQRHLRQHARGRARHDERERQHNRGQPHRPSVERRGGAAQRPRRRLHHQRRLVEHNRRRDRDPAQRHQRPQRHHQLRRRRDKRRGD